MARYIDSKYLVDWCNEMYQKQTQIKGKEYCNAFLQAVVTAPTADVAPKSEVARAFRQRMNEKMGKHTHLLGKEYVQRIMREIEKEFTEEKE